MASVTPSIRQGSVVKPLPRFRMYRQKMHVISPPSREVGEVVFCTHDLTIGTPSTGTKLDGDRPSRFRFHNYQTYRELPYLPYFALLPYWLPY